MTYYAIRTAPQREFALAGRPDGKGGWQDGRLQKLGFEALLPIEAKDFIKRVSRSEHRYKIIKHYYPKYRGYALVNLSDRPEVRNLQALVIADDENVLGFIRYRLSCELAPVLTSAIVEIKRGQDRQTPHSLSVNTHKALRAGERALIRSGPFEGKIRKLAGLDGNTATFEERFFGVDRLVEIDVSQLEVA